MKIIFLAEIVISDRAGSEDIRTVAGPNRKPVADQLKRWKMEFPGKRVRFEVLVSGKARRAA